MDAEDIEYALSLNDIEFEKSDKIITYCVTGMTSSVLFVGLKLAGFENVANYDGSMAEWSKAENDVESELWIVLFVINWVHYEDK